MARTRARKPARPRCFAASCHGCNGRRVCGRPLLCSYFMLALAASGRGRGGPPTPTADHRFSPRPSWPGRPPGPLAASGATGMDGCRTYAQMPEYLDMRELRVHVHQPGFRTERFVVVTTLTDHRTYAAPDIASLYHQRWLVSWIFAPSRPAWAWTCCDAVRRTWCATKSGPVCWPTLDSQDILEAAFAAEVSRARLVSPPRCKRWPLAGRRAAHGHGGQVRLIDLYRRNLADDESEIDRTVLNARHQTATETAALLTKPRAAARRDKRLVAGRRRTEIRRAAHYAPR